MGDASNPHPSSFSLQPSALTSRLHDRNAGPLASADAGIVHPGELDFSGSLRDRVELQIRIRRHAGTHPGVKDFHAVVARNEIVDDVLWNDAAAIVESKAGLHRVLDGDPDLDHFAPSGLPRYLNPGYHRSRVTSHQVLSNIVSIETCRLCDLNFSDIVPE